MKLTEPKIVVVGSVNTDMVVKGKRIPSLGETVLGGEFMMNFGGKGANQAVAAARLGAQVTFIARIGNDSFGKDAYANFQKEGINLDYIVWDKNIPSGVALIMVSQEGENIISVASGANANLSPKDIIAGESAIQNADFVLLQLEIPIESIETAIDLAKKHHVKVILNPAPAIQLSAKLLEKVDILTPNQTEATYLVGDLSASDPKEIMGLLHTKYNIRNIVITLGENGALISGEDEGVVPSYSVNPIDTVGAGDAFNAGLAVSLARGDYFVEAVRFANAVAALSTTRHGAQSAMPMLEEVTAFLKQNQTKNVDKVI